MSQPRKSAPPEVATNNTVKLPAALQRRVQAAMALAGFTVWSEFCRVALTEKCQAIEERLRAREMAAPHRRNGEPLRNGKHPVERTAP